MQISYKNNKIERNFSSPKELLRAYGVRAKKINQRVQEFMAAASLDVMRQIPQARCHELSNGNLAVDVSTNYRIVFTPDHDPVPRKNDGGLDWALVTQICILSVEDYH